LNNQKTAAVLLIGDELLSGRTRDINLQTIATFLAPLGIQVAEARIVSDTENQIIAALNQLREQFDYVFTTGGIGPTHDDITADCVAKAFGDHIDVRPDALDLLTEHYSLTGIEFTKPRKRMARIPDSASLIKNPVSTAPGFQIGNVFVMAGVPSIVRGMLEDVGWRLESGAVVQSATLRIKGAREGSLAEKLGEIAKAYPDLSVGSYPWYGSPEDTGVHIVIRGIDEALMEQAVTDASAMVSEAGLIAERLSVD